MEKHDEWAMILEIKLAGNGLFICMHMGYIWVMRFNKVYFLSKSAVMVLKHSKTM